ncbi:MULTISPECIES: hypothetical protein [Micrococcales]|uniref:Uncharacterized protein n=2 Tax=Micrococcales TaxID=85006 RepID=A0A2N7S105_9MICC|nr:MULTISPECIES: hypothetical protein [Micrococcales]MDN5811484.1 hypothetical protein [Micrococcaceae bacterium]PCC18329.1 hypothetical protein CIK79_08530 [Brevibacterium aurantiacum]PMQ19807.1 hypothetical protein CIK84_14310 [Glutamicibacter arilaitensis]HCJ54024.1 hypothetical protein [Glutamicibacter sp.]HCM95366.1 hypothetical protein [Glutamicibacter sp.]
MSSRRDRRTPQHPPAATPEQPVVVPAVLPQILLEAINAETLIATINGDKLSATPIRRSDIAQTLTELVARLGSPTRVEVREMDGSIHADILTPPAPRSSFAPPADAPPTVTPPSLWEFTANGFVPGEDVALALVIRHTSAGPTGSARVLLDRGETPVVTGEVILLGRISGTTSVQRID